MSSLTIPIAQHPTDADREAGLALINQCMPRFAAGMHAADDATLRHEAERLEAQRPSKVVATMRAIVDWEMTARREAVAHV